jgi:imidazolonepropionase
LRDAGVQPVLLPGPYSPRPHPIPARTRDGRTGLAIVLATDFNPGSSPVPSMPFVSTRVRADGPVACRSAPGRHHQRRLWCQSRRVVGSLEPGKQADFLIHEFTDYRELAYFIAAPARPRVFIAGRETTP